MRFERIVGKLIQKWFRCHKWKFQSENPKKETEKKRKYLPKMEIKKNFFLLKP